MSKFITRFCKTSTIKWAINLTGKTGGVIGSEPSLTTCFGAGVEVEMELGGKPAGAAKSNSSGNPNPNPTESGGDSTETSSEQARGVHDTGFVAKVAKVLGKFWNGNGDHSED